MASKGEFLKRIEQEEADIARKQSYAPTKHIPNEIFRLVLIFIAIFLAIFAFRVGKTLLGESDPGRPGYVTYRECVDSDSDYSRFGERSYCVEYRTRSLTITQRLSEHAKSSLLLPSLLLAVYMLYRWGERKSYRDNIRAHNVRLNYLHGELEKLGRGEK